MLRPARRWSILVALAGVACAGEPAARDPNQPAGKVVELAGGVSAAREGAAVRPLAVGAEVFADDTVTTGPDGSAVILLAHNQVRWNLGSDKSLRVDRSLAWKAKADEGGSAFDDEDEMATASAGRHTDREAGDTAATAQLPPAAAPESAPVEGAPAAPPPPPDTIAEAESAAPAMPTTRALRKRKSTGGSGGLVAEKSNSSKDLLLDQDAPGGATRGASGGGAGGGGAAGRAAAAAAPVPPKPLDAPSPESAPAPTAQAPKARAVVAGNLVLGALAVKGGLTAAQIGARFAGFARSCRGTVAGKVTLRFDIDGKGAVKNVRLSGSSNVLAPISACVSAAARGLTFPAAAGGAATAVEREILVSPAK